MKRLRITFIIFFMVSFFLALSLPVYAQQKRLPQITTRQTTPSKKIDRTMINTKKLDSNEFHAVVSKIFSGATFHANTCGDSNDQRKTSIYIPKRYNKKEQLGRIQYNLTGGESKKSTYNPAQGERRRLMEMHVCIDNWKSSRWIGSAKDGKYVITLPITTGSGNTAIISSIGLFDSVGSAEPMHHAESNSRIQDYIFQDLTFDVYLTPRREGTKMTYSTVEVLWHSTREDVPDHDLFRRVPSLKQKIIDYKKSNLELIRRRIANIFNDPEVKSFISDNLSRQIRVSTSVDPRENPKTQNQLGNVMSELREKGDEQAREEAERKKKEQMAKGAIRGRITTRTGKPAVGFLVKAWDEDDAIGGKHDFMGKAITDSNGRYSISYLARPKGSRWDGGLGTVWRPDIFVVVYAKIQGKWVKVKRSKVYEDWKMAKNLTINLKITSIE